MKKHLSLKEVCELIYTFSLSSAAKAASDVMQSVEPIETAESGRRKLEFDLSIPFLVVAAGFVCNNVRWSKDLQKRIMDGVCDRYFEDLDKVRTESFAPIDSEFFVRDADEKELVRQHASLNTSTQLPKTDLYTLATCLFQKRFLEYQKLHMLDVQEAVIDKGGFPEMPRRVYEHSSGKPSTSPDGFPFTLTLFMALSAFSLALAQQLSDASVMTEEAN